MGKDRKADCKGFSLIETLVVVVIISILVAIAVPLYITYIDKVNQQVCEVNRVQLENMYNVYLLMEETDHSDYIFDSYIETYDKSICPKGGQIQYLNGKVECNIHNKIGQEKDDDEDGIVPFLCFYVRKYLFLPYESMLKK